MDRKEFIKTGSAGVALSMMPFNILKGVDDRVVRLGFIGVGSRGSGHLRGMLNRDDVRSEEHTSELQSRGHLVCRLLLEKKKETTKPRISRTPGKTSGR